MLSYDQTLALFAGVGWLGFTDFRADRQRGVWVNKPSGQIAFIDAAVVIHEEWNPGNGYNAAWVNELLDTAKQMFMHNMWF
jgi:hypothetical protein